MKTTEKFRYQGYKIEIFIVQDNTIERFNVDLE